MTGCGWLWVGWLWFETDLGPGLWIPAGDHGWVVAAGVGAGRAEAAFDPSEQTWDIAGDGFELRLVTDGRTTTGRADVRR